MLDKKQLIAYWLLMLLDIFLLVALAFGPLILIPFVLFSLLIQSAVLSLHYQKPAFLCRLATKYLV
jgi:hypothetical protein